MSFDYDAEMEHRQHYVPGVTGENDGVRAMVDRYSPVSVAGVLEVRQGSPEFQEALVLQRSGRNPDGSLISGVDVVDPITGGAKGMKPERYGLIPTWPLAELARVYGYGARKYSDNNWRLGYRWGLSYDAL